MKQQRRLMIPVGIFLVLAGLIVFGIGLLQQDIDRSGGRGGKGDALVAIAVISAIIGVVVVIVGLVIRGTRLTAESLAKATAAQVSTALSAEAQPGVSARLKELQSLHAEGLVTDAEYESRRAHILQEL